MAALGGVEASFVAHLQDGAAAARGEGNGKEVFYAFGKHCWGGHWKFFTRLEKISGEGRFVIFWILAYLGGDLLRFMYQNSSSQRTRVKKNQNWHGTTYFNFYDENITHGLGHLRNPKLVPAFETYEIAKPV